MSLIMFIAGRVYRTDNSYTLVSRTAVFTVLIEEAARIEVSKRIGAGGRVVIDREGCEVLEICGTIGPDNLSLLFLIRIFSPQFVL